MQFAIGYRLPDECDSISEIVADYPDGVSEVYFALPSDPSGRSPLGHEEGWSVADAKDVLSTELAHLAQMKVGAVLLFNASCYGANAMSYELQERIRQGVAFVEKTVPLKAVTTTSLFIARFLKSERPDIPVRASVNMRIGSIPAMEQLADAFDGYYLKRELNRSPAAIAELRSWCDASGKSLHLLANSGCLYDCAYQSFHDNLVAHEVEAACVSGPGVKYPAPCWEFLDNPGHWHRLLQNTWIRPEDIHNYEASFDTVKLATRVHPRPRMVVAAYARQQYHGNLLDLLEPGHSGLPSIPSIDNSLFPEDWFERTTSCGHRCWECSYCANVFEKVRFDPPDVQFFDDPEEADSCDGSCRNCPSRDAGTCSSPLRPA